MQSRIPARHRFRLLAVYSSLVLRYNVVIATLGAIALLLLRRAGLIEGVVSARVGIEVGALVLATAGHWLSVLVFGVAHHREYALFRSGGWAPIGLQTASWVLAIVVGTAIFVTVRV